MFKRKEIVIGYARVSTSKQDLGLDVQKEALGFCDYLFIETESGSKNNRKILNDSIKLCKQFASEGKEVQLVIYKLDRLTRSMFELLKIIEDLNKNNIELVSLHEQIETKSLTGKLLCIILGFVAESELENLRFRTKEGLRKAKERGVKLGTKRMPKSRELKIIKLYKENQKSVREIAYSEKISTSTIYQILKRNNIPKKSFTKGL